MTMHEDQVDVTTGTVAGLIGDQFPEWGGLEVRFLPSTGTVNAIFRVGDGLAARFPLRAAGGAAEVSAALRREAEASAELARVSPFPVPEPVALGEPGAGFPLPWSVQTWLAGTAATARRSRPVGAVRRGPRGLPGRSPGGRHPGAAVQRRGAAAGS
ncbi:hypothetical protein GCM10020229_23580 [Kitasatospora albolonga]